MANPSILKPFDEAGVTLTAEGRDIKFKALGGLTDEQREFIKSNRVQLLLELPNGDPIATLALKNDRKFVRDPTAKITPQKKKEVLAEYFHRWEVAAAKQPITHKKENAGRFASNTWLLNRMESQT